MEELPKTIAFSDDNGDAVPSNNQSTEGGHNRGGSNISDLFDPPQGSIAPASLNRRASMESDALRSIAENARMRLEHNTKGENESQKITLDGLFADNQYEHEATTHILKTLEDRLGSSQAAFETSILEGLSNEASKAVLDESSPLERVAQQTTNANSHQDRKPLLSSKPRHGREMSLDDHLANLTDQLLDHGFLDTAPDQAPAIAHLSEFERNAQVAFGVNPVPDNSKAREKPKLEPVKEGSGGDNANDGNPFGDDGVVDLESPPIPENESQRFHKPPNKFADASQRTESDSSGSGGYRTTLSGMTEQVKNDVAAWNFFFRPSKATIKKYIKLLLYVMLPLMGVAALLFYLVDNPTRNGGEGPSVSWILLFVVQLLGDPDTCIGCSRSGN